MITEGTKSPVEVRANAALRQMGVRPQDFYRLAEPAGFAKYVLKMDLYPKQVEACNAFKQLGCQVSFAAANGTGKTAIVLPCIILWHLFIYPAGTIALTSAKWQQIEDQVMPALYRYRKKFPQWHWYDSPRIDTNQGGFFTTFSTKQPGHAEGFHGNGPDAPLAVIIDEAKSAEPWLEGVVEGRIHPDRLMLSSSHGYAEGWFWASQTIRSKDFKCITLRAVDCPHFPQQYIEDTRRKFGASGLARSILGEGFLPLVEDAVLDYKAIDWLVANPPAPEYGEIHAFCDFAWSNDGDMSVLALRNGNKVTIEAAFRRDGLHEVCDEFVSHFKRLHLESWHISGDAGGGGSLVMDELDRRGWKLQRWNNGSEATEPEQYQDSKAQVWYNGGQLIDMKKVILPDNDELRNQMINRKRKAGTKGRLAIETKKEMKERGIPSPDLADACAPQGTLISTQRGLVPIENVLIGDNVLTPFGYSDAVQLHKRSIGELFEIELTTGKKLQLTGNHKIFTREYGWVRADKIILHTEIESVYDCGLWKYLNSSFTRVANIAFKQLADIIKTKTGTAHPSDFFTEESGMMRMDQFQKECAFITKTETGQTINFPIWNSWVCQSIAPSMFNKICETLNGWLRLKEVAKRQFSKLLNGIAPKMELNGIGNMEKKPWRSVSTIFPNPNANIATSLIRQPRSINISAQLLAGRNLDGEILQRSASVRSAELSFQQTNRVGPAIAVKNVKRLQFSESVTVFNLTLREENVYYANGVLVENCLGAMMPKGGWYGGNVSYCRPQAVGRWEPMGC